MSKDKEIWLRPSIVDGVLCITDQDGRRCRGLVDFEINSGEHLSVTLTSNVYSEPWRAASLQACGYDYEIKTYETK